MKCCFFLIRPRNSINTANQKDNGENAAWIFSSAASEHINIGRENYYENFDKKIEILNCTC